MLKYFLDFSKITLLLGVMMIVSCSETKNETDESSASDSKSEQVITHTPASLMKEIEQLEDLVKNPEIVGHEKKVAQLIEYYDDYVRLFGGDKMVPEMLLRAGNQSVNLKRYQKAIAYYNSVETKFPRYLKRPEAIYLQGMVYESYLNELGKAKEQYEKLIKKYPDHVLATPAQYSLDNLGKSDEELIREFEKKNASN